MIDGVQRVSFSKFCDAARGGSLTYGQYGDQIPFDVKRFFYIDDVPAGGKRGAHAHQFVKQCLICVRGAVEVLVDNGRHKQSIVLDTSTQGLVLQELIWSEQTYIQPGSALLVLASETYDEGEYVRDYGDFVVMATKKVTLASAASAYVKVVGNSPNKENKDTHNIVAKSSIVPLDLRPDKDELAAMTQACARVLQSGHYVLGPDVAAFEDEWAAFCETKHAVGVGSGLDAIFLMLKAANLRPGGGVIVPANTYIATIIGIRLAGLTPVLVEPDGRTYNLDPAAVADAVTDGTVAILAVDLYGQPADANALRHIAHRHNIKLFCDAAQSHGATINRRKACSLYDGCAFSFYPSKNLGAVGEAGAVVTNDAALADQVRVLRNYGSRKRYYNEQLGVNSRLDTLQAALLRIRLASLDANNAHRARLAACYARHLKSVPWLTLPFTMEGTQPVWHQFVVLCDTRDKLRQHLARHDIETLVHYPVPPHLAECMQDLGLAADTFLITERLASRVLSLPIGPHLTENDVVAVCNCIKSFRVE